MTIHWFWVDSMMLLLLASVPNDLDRIRSSVHPAPPTKNPHLIQMRNVMDVDRNLICHHNLIRKRRKRFHLNIYHNRRKVVPCVELQHYDLKHIEVFKNVHTRSHSILSFRGDFFYNKKKMSFFYDLYILY